MLLSVRPSPLLEAHVAGYWFVRDIEGVYRGKPIITSPQPGGVLTINFGRPNAMVGGPVVPRVSLLGVQTEGRRWRSDTETFFVMVMLTCVGMASLLPGQGSNTVNRLVELSALLGDRTTRELAADVSARSGPASAAHALDEWLLRRLERSPPAREQALLGRACQLLGAGGSVQEVAEALAVSRRHLGRWFETHVGLGPKAIRNLQRFRDSLHAVQRREGDALAGFSDQAHQIREWRRRIGFTPSRYTRTAPSPMASYFNSSSRSAPPFYL